MKRGFAASTIKQASLTSFFSKQTIPSCITNEEKKKKTCDSPKKHTVEQESSPSSEATPEQQLLEKDSNVNVINNVCILDERTTLVDHNSKSDDDDDDQPRCSKRLRRTLCVSSDDDNNAEDLRDSRKQIHQSIKGFNTLSEEEENVISTPSTENLTVNSIPTSAQIDTNEDGLFFETTDQDVSSPNGYMANLSDLIFEETKDDVEKESCMENHSSNMINMRFETKRQELLESYKVLNLNSDDEKNTFLSDVCEVEKSKRFLLSLPIAQNSLYFREYVEITSSVRVATKSSSTINSVAEPVSSRSFPTWLLPDNITDNQRRRPDDPLYDVSTLWVPLRGSKEAKAEPKHFTPAMEQFWEVKTDHFDKIVFFKIGKFYEIFYVDAFIANRICGLRWMGSDEKPHVGFPEPSLHYHAQTLVNSGFKVVVVEQMETPKELEERNNNAVEGKKSKAVKREVCEVFTIGTLLHEAMLPTEARLLLALMFHKDQKSFGYTFCDVSTCSFWVGEFQQTDLNERTRNTLVASPILQAIKSLMLQTTPVEVVIDQSNCPPEILETIKRLPLTPHINILPLNQFQDIHKFKEIKEVLGSGLKKHDNFMMINNKSHPSFDIVEQNMSILNHLESQPNIQLALVLLIRYLEGTLLADKLLAFGRFEIFYIYGSNFSKSSPLTTNNTTTTINESSNSNTSMMGEGFLGGSDRLIMDSTTLRHLSILQEKDGSSEGTLFKYINHTVTASGYRLLKRWLTAPLLSCSKINDRLDVVDWFLQHHDALKELRNSLKTLPDVERSLTKVCTRGLQGLRGAVYFDDVHTKHFTEFVKLLNSFILIQEALTKLQTYSSDLTKHQHVFPKRLQHLCCLSKKETTMMESDDADEDTTTTCFGYLPPLAENIENLIHCLIQNTTTQAWTLAEGVDEAYDDVMSQIRHVEKELEQHLEELIKQSKLQHPNVSKSSNWDMVRYVHTKFPYEIEAPESSPIWKDTKNLDNTAHDLTSSRQGFVRFRTSTILDLVEKKETLQVLLKDTMYGCQQRLFQRFYQSHFSDCLTMIASMAEIDVLSGFAIHALPVYHQFDVPVNEAMCRPIFLDDSNTLPVLRLLQCRHPIVAASLPPGVEYIPNDIRLNDPEDTEGNQSFFLVTGPNMGGKSTLLRQACLTVILAQLGCYVPAAHCTMNVVDRIFTRLGAYDSILEGKSTFLVELEETAAAVSDATSQSLVVLDELGRGTSTFDGTAIALAVAEYLATYTKCRCLFATHFQLLTEELQPISSIRLVHMAALLKDDTLVFLYKLVTGACPKSHGIRIAKLAGLSENIVLNAEKKADSFQTLSMNLYVVLRLQLFRKEIADAVESSNKNANVWCSIRERVLKLASSPLIHEILFTPT